MKKLLLTIFLLFFVVIVVMTAQVDDDLSKESADLIGRIDTVRTSESYLYLYGIFASEGDEPAKVGRKILEEYRKLDNNDSYEVIEYPDEDKIPLPTGDEFCKAWEKGCLEYIFSSQYDIDSLLNENKLLLARSSKFFEFAEYETLSKPTVHELFPPYQYIAAAERIKILEAISVYSKGNATRALESLSLQFSKLRKSMALQDNLIGKLVLLMKLSEVIDVMSVILSNSKIEAKLIPDLTQSEKSFHMIAAREFGMSYYTFKNLDKHPEFFEIGGDFPGWMTRTVYKPNMTINAIAPIYYKLEQLAQFPSVDFAKRIEANNSDRPSTSKLRNYVGSVLIAISPEYTEYVARFYDLDAKLAIFNQVHHLNLSLDDMKNPYYGKEVPEVVNGNLCFNGPLEDKRSLRCLRVKI